MDFEKKEKCPGACKSEGRGLFLCTGCGTYSCALCQDLEPKMLRLIENRFGYACKSCASERKTPEKSESGLVWRCEKSVQEAMAALSRGEEGSTNKVLMMLCVLFLRQTHRQNRMEGKRQEAEPVSVNLLHPDAGMHPSTRRSSTQSSRSGNRLNSQGEGHVFKKYGWEEEQPWMQHKRGKKGTGQKYPAEQTEATVEAAGEAD
jgi:hypothetical protein